MIDLIEDLILAWDWHIGRWHFCRLPTYKGPNMDTQVKDTIVWTKNIGMIPAESVVATWTDGAKPAPTPKDGMRISFVGSKSKDGKQDEKLAVEVTKYDPDNFTGVDGHKFMSALLNDYQDGLVSQVKAGNLSFEVVNDQVKMMVDYFDTSRDSSGRKITKEKIAEYFMSSTLATVVTARAVAKNAQIKEETLAGILKGYADMFGRLTKFDLVSIYTEPQVKLIRQLLDASEKDGNEIREYIDVKFAKVEAAVQGTNNLLDAI